MEKILNARACLRQDELQGYLDNSLSDDQRFDIENHLLDCPLCEAALAGFAAADPQRSQEQLAKIKAAIPSIAANQKPESPTETSAKVKPLRRRNWIMAAAAIGLLLLSTVLYRQYGPQTPEQLFAQSFQPYESPFSGSRNSETADSPLSKGLAAFQLNDFNRAIPLLESAIDQGDESFIAYFHAGLSYLQSGDYANAAEYLSTTRMNAETFYSSATWYLALTHLKENQPELCRDYLLQIKSDDEEYYLKAQKLLARLK